MPQFKVTVKLTAQFERWVAASNGLQAIALVREMFVGKVHEIEIVAVEEVPSGQVEGEIDPT